MFSQHYKPRLPFRFHQSFIPERQYLAAMLRYAAGEKDGDLARIAEETGIPMGRSSGKAQAILDYCIGMGLVMPLATRNASKAPRLSHFGRIVLLEDPQLNDRLTQWLAHFHLCRVRGGAEAWYLAFIAARAVCGDVFKRGQLEDFLRHASGKRSKRSLVGPILRTYTDPAALGRTGLLELLDPETYRRKSAPILREYCRGYAAWITTLLEEAFPNQRQITLTDLQARCGCQDVGGWSVSQHEQLLALIQGMNLIDVDRQMRPWVVTRRLPSQDIWSTIYDDLV
jgi:hypothetical protein